MPIQNDFSSRMLELGIEEDILAVVNDLAEKYNEEYK